MLTLFDDNMPDTEKLSSIVTELFLRGSKFNISLVFISQSYFNVSIRLNATHYFVTKIPNKRELQQIASNHLSDIEFKGFTTSHKDYTKEPFSLLVNKTLLSDNTSIIK